MSFTTSVSVTRFENCLCNILQFKVSCYLHMCSLWRHAICLLTNPENDQVIVILTEFLYMSYWHMTVDIAFKAQLHDTGFVSERHQFKVFSSLVCSYNSLYLKLLFKFNVAPMRIRYRLTGALVFNI
jgi:hypothetical protein